ncbi:hypothetical protein GCM10009640_25680 [Agrococcus citreus]|uniref:Uncharacterized protein n=1 Tax=Agrococcus citreus TaxID=84643 RepID=A0ABN1Z0Z4_9MICO
MRMLIEAYPAAKTSRISGPTKYAKEMPAPFDASMFSGVETMIVKGAAAATTMKTMDMTPSLPSRRCGVGLLDVAIEGAVVLMVLPWSRRSDAAAPAPAQVRTAMLSLC